MSRGWPLHAAYVVIAGAVLADVVLTVTGHRSVAGVVAAFLPVQLVGLTFSLLAASHSGLDRRGRRPWRLVAACCALQLGYGPAVGIALDHVAARTGRVDAALIIAIAVRVTQSTVLLMGLFAFAARPLTALDRRKTALDVSIVVSAAAMGIWYWLVGPGLFTLGRHDTDIHLALVLLPVCDLVLTAGVVTVLVRGVVPGSARSVFLLLAGVASNLGVDLNITYHAVLTSSSRTSLPADLLAFVPLILLDAAAIERCRTASAPRDDSPAGRTARPYPALPYLALAAGNTFLIVIAVRSSAFPWSGLVLTSFAMTAAVAGRQLVSLREHHRLAVTDALTGLTNRLPLHDRITQAARAHETNALLLIDLDGFKQINDTYGHEAGDDILVAFAALLRRHTRSADVRARLGGDEFALVLAGIGDTEHAVGVAERLIAELRGAPLVPRTADRPALDVGCSIGIAMIDNAPPFSPDDQLQHADQAMYAAKRLKTTGWHLAVAADQGSSRPSELAG